MIALRLSRPIVALLVLSGALHRSAAAGQVESRSPGSPFSIALDVDVVLLDVRVRDHRGASVPGLEAGNFRVYVDGQRQAVEFFGQEDIPVTIGLAVDSSHSMRKRWNDVVLAALGFVSASNPEDEIFIVGFNDSVWFGLPRERPFSRNVVELRAALLRLEPAGQTALYDALVASLDHLERGRHRKRVLVVISDGGDNRSRATYPEVLERVRRAPVTIYALSLYDELARERNAKVLKELARASGGDYFEPEDAEQMGGEIRRVARDIRSRYVLAYRPEQRSEGYHKVRVEVDVPGRRNLRVSAREGYVTTARKGTR